jgi:hypothetical protein
MTSRDQIFEYTNGETNFRTYIDLQNNSTEDDRSERTEPIYVDYDKTNFRRILNYYRSYSKDCISNNGLKWDLERLSVAINCESMIVNVEGKRYKVGLPTLKKIPYFRALINFRSQMDDTKNETELIDRDHISFREIVSCLRNPHGNLSEFKFSYIPIEEFDYYGFPSNLFTKKPIKIKNLILNKENPKLSTKRREMEELLNDIIIGRCENVSKVYKRQIFNNIPELGKLCDCNIKMSNHNESISEIYLYLKFAQVITDKNWNPIKYIEIMNSEGEVLVRYEGDVIAILQGSPFNLYQKNVDNLNHRLIKIDIGNKRIFTKSLIVSVLFQDKPFRYTLEEHAESTKIEESYLVVKYEESGLDLKSENKLIVPSQHGIESIYPGDKSVKIKYLNSMDSIILIIYVERIIEYLGIYRNQGRMKWKGIIQTNPDLSVKVLVDKEEVCKITKNENKNNQINNFGWYDPRFLVIDLTEIRKKLYFKNQMNLEILSKLDFDYLIDFGDFPNKTDIDMGKIIWDSWSCNYFTLDVQYDII